MAQCWSYDVATYRRHIRDEADVEMSRDYCRIPETWRCYTSPMPCDTDTYDRKDAYESGSCPMVKPKNQGAMKMLVCNMLNAYIQLFFKTEYYASLATYHNLWHIDIGKQAL